MWWLLATLAFGGELLGGVFDVDEQPVEGAYIGLYDTFFELVATVGPTSVDGRWRVEVAPGRYRVRVVPGMELNLVEAWVPGEVQDECDAEPFDVVSEAVVDGADLALAEGGIIRGRVLDGAGWPAESIEVWAAPASGGITTQERADLTGSQGRFELRGLTPGETWVVELRGEDRPDQLVPGTYSDDAAEVLSVEAGQTVQAPDTHLSPGITVGGQVRAPDGGLAEVFVFVYSDGQIEVDKTDEEGRYEVLGLRPGEVVAWVSTDGYAKTYHPNLPTPEVRVPLPDDNDRADDVDLDLPIEARITGQLIGAGDLSAAGVVAFTPDQSVGLGVPSTEDGVFSVGRLHGGPWNLYLAVDGAGYLPGYWLDDDGERMVIDVPAEQEVHVRVPLRPAAQIVGRITDPDGLPVPNADLLATSEISEELIYAVSDENGEYALRGLVGDSWHVLAELNPPCRVDPARVRMHLGDTPDPNSRRPAVLAAGEVLTWNPTLPDDADRDGMDDRWERRVGLDPTRDDSGEDPDGDLVLNRVEYWEDSDPLRGRTCGCDGTSGVGSWWLGWSVLWLVGRRRRSRSPGLVERL
ncbi:MAG: hypothetical protein ACI9MC_004140 [Kiritimatiellia bacterium]|jgi:hypothetical protein